MKKIKIACFLLCLIIASGTLAKTVYAKYVNNRDVNMQVNAAKFYFDFEKLVNGGTLDLNYGTDSVSFNLLNHENNPADYSDIDIGVSVTAKDLTTNTDIQVTCSDNIPGGSANSITVTLDLSNVTSGDIVEVIAKGSNGYHKTISTSFTVLPPSTP